MSSTQPKTNKKLIVVGYVLVALVFLGIGIGLSRLIFKPRPNICPSCETHAPSACPTSAPCPTSTCPPASFPDPLLSFGTFPITGRFLILKRVDKKGIAINIGGIKVFESPDSTTPYSGITGYLYNPLSGYPASNALDNDTNSFAHTLDDPFASMIFDLGSDKRIGKVVINNRSDCCKDRIKDCALVIQNSNLVQLYSRVITDVTDTYTFT